MAGFCLSLSSPFSFLLEVSLGSVGRWWIGIAITTTITAIPSKKHGITQLVLISLCSTLQLRRSEAQPNILVDVFKMTPESVQVIAVEYTYDARISDNGSGVNEILVTTTLVSFWQQYSQGKHLGCDRTRYETMATKFRAISKEEEDRKGCGVDNG
uniref:Uncharacterized protein n=1 Tax=Vespula pensylvanica TaxID=30213 RepID=A0A834UGF3_VESPE|nr:hypothetical protein H0235_001057 [Vespula pensylvanica]